MKRIAVLGMLAAASLLAQPGPRGRGMGPGGDFHPVPPGGPHEQVVTGAPFSAQRVTITQQVLPDGNVISRQEQESVFRDGQGRTRHETSMKRPDGQTVRHVSISDPVAGAEHSLDVENKTAFSSRRPAGRFGGPPPQRPSTNVQADPNVKQEDLGTQVINGVSATGTRITHTIPAGTIGNSQPIQSVRETWVSADLKVPVMIKTSDPRRGTTVTSLNNILRVEPDAALFQVPSDYTVKRGPGPGGRGPGGGNMPPRPARKQ